NNSKRKQAKCKCREQKIAQLQSVSIKRVVFPQTACHAQCCIIAEQTSKHISNKQTCKKRRHGNTRYAGGNSRSIKPGAFVQGSYHAEQNTEYRCQRHCCQRQYYRSRKCFPQYGSYFSFSLIRPSQVRIF